ncbi:MAG: hypothetical protein R3F49_23790 [Planctomycetota bacterium]
MQPIHLVATLSLASTAALAQGSYSYTLFDITGSTGTTPSSIDAAGRVTGDFRDGSARYHGFERGPSGALTPIDHPGATDTHLAGTNDLGVTVGRWSVGPGSPSSFSYSAAGFVSLGALPGNLGGPSGINSAGTIVGSYSDFQFQQHGYVSVGGGITIVDYPGATHTNLVDVNDNGLIIGNYWDGSGARWRGFTYDGAQFVPLDKPGAHWTYLSGLNNVGQIVGQQVDVSGSMRTAILYDQGAWSDVLVPNVVGWSSAQDINDSGTLCGYWQGPWNGVYGQHGFVAEREPGARYCAAVANSTGNAGRMSAEGSASVAANDLVLRASDLPLNAFGYFLTSATQGLVPNPGGSYGDLCLGGAIGRFNAPTQVQNSGSSGMFALALDLQQQPTPAGAVAVQPGETWHFTTWYRDSQGGVVGSNFADGYSVTFE